MPPAPSPKSQLNQHGLLPKRHFGQNFLADAGLADRIAELCAAPGASVIELGAGLGALTRPLLARAGHLIAVERDRDLVPLLESEFSESIRAGRLEVLEADAKAIEPEALLRDLPRPHVLCGNLPYQITGPLIQLAVRSAAQLDHAVFLVQLEVAARLNAQPGSSEYGALTVFTRAAFEITRPLVIRRGAFYPQPGVDSAVISMLPKAAPVRETAVFSALVRAAFGQRRKKLHNAWRGVRGLSDPALEELSARVGIDLNQRGETLSVEAFAAMAAAIEATQGGEG